MTAPAVLHHAPDPAALVSARQAAGLTQIDVAAALGKHWMTISRYERGLIDMPGSVLGALAGLYGVHPGDFWPTT